MDQESDFRQAFLRQRENIRQFQRLYENNLANAASNPDFRPSRNLSITKHGVEIQIWAPDAEGNNKSQISHSFDCPERKPAISQSGWEYKFETSPQELIERYSQLIFDNSEVARNALRDYQGFWQQRIANLKWASARGDLFPGSAESWHREYPLELNTIEFLVPGLGTRFVEEFESTEVRAELISVNPIVSIFDNKVPATTAAIPAKNYDVMRAVVLTILDAVNRFRDDCAHPSATSCGLCGELLEPDFSQNAEYMLPENYCAWCFLVIDYHDENSLLYEGFAEHELKELMISSFTKLVSLSGFPYWKTPVLSKDLMIELNLRARTADEAKEFAYLFASMPKRSKLKPLFETPQHFFHAAGLEELVPRGKGRGIRSISRCGHLCLSMGEREICEYLYINGVMHTKEPQYSALVEDGSAFGSMRGDFLVGGVVIEFAGLDGEEAYDVKMKLKRKLAEEHGLTLIVLRPEDINNLSEILTLPLS